MRYKELKEFTDPKYIKRLAEVESSGNPNAEAKTSSATGMYQFIDKTWNSLVDKYDLGYSLEDRKDPEKSLKVLKLFTDENESYLERKLGRKPTHSELYLAHFSGMGRAGQLLSANPDKDIRQVLPENYITSNKQLFEKNNIRTVRDMYNWAAKKFDSPLLEEEQKESRVREKTNTEKRTFQIDNTAVKSYYKQPEVITADYSDEEVFESKQAKESDKKLRKTEAAFKIQELFKQPQQEQQTEQYQQPDLEDAYNYIDIDTYQDGGEIPTSKNGLYDYPKQTVKVPTTNGNITMEGINYPVFGIADTGEQILMQPGKKYNFKGAKEVLEIPQL